MGIGWGRFSLFFSLFKLYDRLFQQAAQVFETTHLQKQETPSYLLKISQTNMGCLEQVWTPSAIAIVK
jgi:hypothetical protein